MSLQAHLATGSTTVARAWKITRRDGVVLGFTDHDRALRFGGVTYAADAGLTAQALVQTSGLSVDNTEALGALFHDAITEADIVAGRYDGAEVEALRVNWADPTEREVLFCGTIGEVRHGQGAFEAELRGIAQALNQPQGRSYLRQCSAVLGDATCRVDTSAPGFAEEAVVTAVEGNRVVSLTLTGGFAARWFERGRLDVLDGAAAGLTGIVKTDEGAGARVISLWAALGAPLAVGDRVRVSAGCDKRAETCTAKFANMVNFQGFPFIPGEEWLTRYPRTADVNDGGPLR
ncbi:MAG: DUF2163 domain-containing protein [Shimia sp.]